MRGAWLCASSLALLACSVEEHDCVRLKRTCDISLQPCQREVFAATACVRGQSGAKMPPIRGLAKWQYEAELREQAEAADEEDDGGELAWGHALALFGLIPNEQSLEDANIKNSVDNVAAYYSRDTKKVTIILDNTKGFDNGTFTLSHEFVHALQDQREGLDQFYDQYAHDSDSVAALKCLTEGEALTLSNLTLLSATGSAARDVQWHSYLGSMREKALADLAADDAPILSAKWLVYPVGGLGVARAYLGAGLDGIAELYEHPQLTFLAWAEPSARDSEASPLDCAPPEPPEGFERRFEDQQGMLGLLALYVALGKGPRYEDAKAWSGDSFVVYTPIESDSDEVAVAWHIRFQKEEDADAFMDVLSERERAFDMERAGAEVMLRAASSDSLLADWSSAACAGDEKSRRERAARTRIVPRSVLRLWP